MRRRSRTLRDCDRARLHGISAGCSTNSVGTWSSSRCARLRSPGAVTRPVSCGRSQRAGRSTGAGTYRSTAKWSPTCDRPPSPDEINIAETEPFEPRKSIHHAVESSWWSGRADILTFEPEELLATKLRALYQRSKGRDLFDLWLGLT